MTTCSERTKDDHCTPKWLVDGIQNSLGRIETDPCWNEWCHIKPTFAYAGEHRGDKNGLVESWSGLTFIQPPFSDISPWSERVIALANKQDNPMLFYCPRDNRVKWAQGLLDRADAIVDIRGYVKHDGANGNGGTQSFGMYAFNIPEVGLRRLNRVDRFQVWRPL